MRARLLVLVLAVAAVLIPGTAQAWTPPYPTIPMPAGCSEVWPTVGTVTTTAGTFYTVTSHPLVCTAASGYVVDLGFQTTQWQSTGSPWWTATCLCTVGQDPNPPTTWVTPYLVGGVGPGTPPANQWRAMETWYVVKLSLPPSSHNFLVRTWTAGHPF